MSSPFRSGNSDIAKRWLSGSSTNLWMGDSIGVSLEVGMPLYWPGRPNGVAFRGSEIAFFSSDSKVTLAEGGFGAAGAGLAYSTSLYTPWATREAKFTGVAYSAVANNLSNRIMSTSSGGLLLPSTRTADAVDGLDWIAQCSTLQFCAVMYGDSSNQSTLVHPFLMDDSDFSMLVDLGNPNTRDGYHTTWGSCNAQTVAGHTVSMTVRVDAGTPTASAGFSLLLGMLRGDRTGMTVIPASVGGYGLTHWIPGYSTVQTVSAGAMAAFQGLGITDVTIALTTNGPNDGSGGFSTQALYQTQILALVAEIRAYVPDAGITFLAVHDANGANTSGYVDACYAAQKDTPNSQFINSYRACGTYADVNARYLSDGVHLNSGGVRFEIGRIADLMREQAESRTLVHVNRQSKAYHAGIAQAGGASTITLATTASATDNAYLYEAVTIEAGTGAGQSREVLGYVGATRVATVRTWAVTPDTTSQYSTGPTPTAATLATITAKTSQLTFTADGVVADAGVTGGSDVTDVLKILQAQEKAR